MTKLKPDQQYVTIPRTGERTFAMSISITPTEHDIINQAAEAWGIKFSSAVRRIISEWATKETNDRTE